MELERTIEAGGATTDELGVTAAGGSSGASDLVVAEGRQFGRYVLLGRLGEGGMGVVYGAYDPELDRRVALKLLAGSGVGEEGRLRILREAQAMARLQHPNVVTVHEVGSVGGRVYLAMEHVRGATLRQWLAAARRPWRAALEVMRAVARGLIAAHEAGLVHRDVKPENVMIGDDERVRVMDFGLARAEPTGAPAPVSTSSSSLLGSDLTRMGSVVGTPAYLAPEGLLGGATDARADQFGWSVTCWEALYGERPFAGPDIASLRRNVLAGRRRPAPTGGGVPRGVRRVLERGLAGAPGRRYPSMQALLTDLDAALRRWRWRFVGYGVLAAAVGAGAALVHGKLAAEALAERCAAEGAAIAETWGEEPARRVIQAFAATGRPDADEVFARTRPWLDGYAEGWAQARTELCGAAAGGPLTAAQELALECLEERRASLDALVGAVFASAAPDLLTRAPSLASRLPQLAACADPIRLARAPRRPDDPEARARIVALRSSLERAATFQRAGEYPAAMRETEAALAEAEGLGWTPLITQAHIRRGALRALEAAFGASEAELEAALWQAEADGDDEAVVRAATELIYIVGKDLGRPDDGARWGQLALAVLRRIGEEEALGASDTYAALGIVQEARGEFAAAQRLKEKVLELRLRHLGPEHPSVANAYDMLGVIMTERGALEEARVVLERGLTIRLAKLGPSHVEVGNSYVNLGNVLARLKRPAEAHELQRKARDIFAAGRGPGHPVTAIATENMAVCEYLLRDYPRALATHREALAIRERTLDANHPHVAVSHQGIGDVLRAQGDPAGAAAEYRRALERYEASVGPDHPEVAITLQKSASALRQAGELAAALASAERAAAIAARRELADKVRAAIDLSLGQALWELERERERARELLERAAPTLLRDDPAVVLPETEELIAWLSARRDALALALP